MALRVTLTYLGEPDPASTTLTLPIPHVGKLTRDVPHEITARVLAHFPDVSPEALAHRLAAIYNRNQRQPRLRVDTTGKPRKAPVAPPPPEPTEPEPEPTPEPDPAPTDDQSPESQE